jgi:hypothetical protein
MLIFELAVAVAVALERAWWNQQHTKLRSLLDASRVNRLVETAMITKALRSMADKSGTEAEPENEELLLDRNLTMYSKARQL